MRVLVTDDEPPARARLRSMLEELDGVHVVGEAGNGADALDLGSASTSKSERSRSPRRSCSMRRYWRQTSSSRPSVTGTLASARLTRNRSARSSVTCSASTGSLRVRLAMVFMLLNRKCGRIRACSAWMRARLRASTFSCHWLCT